jgi:Holliday junction resolvasome RuvABC endonuclease subunit
MIIAGIDYSLNGPAICLFSGNNHFVFEKCSFYFLTNTKKYASTFFKNIYGSPFSDYDGECERYDTISDWVMKIVLGCDQIGLEDYAYNAQGRVFHIAENTGILKYKFYQASLPVEVFSPSHVKKLATGKGNADKNMMYEAFIKETGIPLQDIITPNKKDIGNPVSDIVDAFYICKSLFLDIKK